MGEARRRAEIFRSQHPFCCFCGGDTPTATFDHQPGRVFFTRRESPDNFRFPACQACNAISKDSENLLRLLAVPENMDAEDRRNWNRSVNWIGRNHPGLIDSLFGGTRFNRASARRLGIAPLHGQTFGDLPIVKLEPALWQRHFEIVGRKLLLALHYQCFNRAISQSGALWVRNFTNADVMQGTFPDHLLELAAGLVEPHRQHHNLSDQFSIRWSYDPILGNGTAVWAVNLHSILYFVGITSDDGELVARCTPESKDILRPFRWS